ncbi:MAG: hypothetical protein IJH87_04060 [Atopobiaceae bacterium]|nr:hypothetical protein [Atopobiaceae bacterium]
MEDGRSIERALTAASAIIGDIEELMGFSEREQDIFEDCLCVLLLERSKTLPGSPIIRDYAYGMCPFGDGADTLEDED